MSYQKSFVLFAVLFFFPALWLFIDMGMPPSPVGLDADTYKKALVLHSQPTVVALMQWSAALVFYVPAVCLFGWIFGKPQPQKEEV